MHVHMHTLRVTSHEPQATRHGSFKGCRSSVLGSCLLSSERSCVVEVELELELELSCGSFHSRGEKPRSDRKVGDSENECMLTR